MPATPPTRLVGGVVAHNEEEKVDGAIRSLLDQELPRGVAWGELWVVASGCTDGTVERVQRTALRDPRVKLVVEPRRRGKAAAVGEVLSRADGDLLVLLNADARARPGALGHLLQAATGLSPPFGIMARPVPPEGGGRMGEALGLLWDLHHELHLLLLSRGRGSHLSDELMLLSLPNLPRLPQEVVNDGAFLGMQISLEGGSLRYAPQALVDLSVPGNLRDHVAQRRRILCGHRQVAQLLHRRTTTIHDLARTHPREALGLVARTVRSRRGGRRELLTLLLAEGMAYALSLWDRLPPRPDHVRWQRLRETAPFPGRTPP